MTKGFENIATKSITWDEVRDYIKTGELYRLRRSKDETVRYRAHKKMLEEKHIVMIDHILGKLNWDLAELEQLNNETYPSNEDKLHASFSKEELFKLLPNDFPYMFDPNIIHLLVWSKIRLPIYLDDHTEVSMEKHNDVLPTMNPSMKAKIEAFLAKTLKKQGLEPGTDYDWFINYTNLQSIKAISHIHLLIKCKSASSEDTAETRRIAKETMNHFLSNAAFEPCD